MVKRFWGNMIKHTRLKLSFNHGRHVNPQWQNNANKINYKPKTKNQTKINQQGESKNDRLYFN